MLAFVVGALGWLLLGFAGSSSAITVLPGADRATLSYIVDKSEQLTVDEIESRPEGEWRPWAEDGYVYNGNDVRVLWVRVVLHNPGDRPLRGVLENDDFFCGPGGGLGEG